MGRLLKTFATSLGLVAWYLALVSFSLGLTPQQLVVLSGTNSYAPSPAPAAVASIDCNLTNQVLSVGCVSGGRDYSVTRLGSETCTDAAGVITYAPPNTPCLTTAGLQVFQASSNILFQSQAFTAGAPYWFPGSSTVTDNSVVAPDGTTTAGKLTEVAATTTHYLSSNNNTGVGVSISTTYTLSIYAKYNGRQFMWIGGSDNSGSDRVFKWFDVQNCATASSSNTGTTLVEVSAAATSVANGFCRISVTMSTTGSFSPANMFTYVAMASADGIFSYLGDVSKFNYVWGVQLEALNFPSPYIPTTTTTAFRSTDNVITSGLLATTLNSAVGSVEVNTNLSQAGVAGTLIDSNGTVLLGKTAGNLGTTALGAALSTGNTGTWTGANDLKLSWSPSAGSIQLNGGTVVTDAQARIPSATSHLGSTSGTSAFLNGNLTRIRVTKNLTPTYSTPAVLVDPVAGNDTNPCNFSRPCKTMPRAQAIARTLHKPTVYVRKGTTLLTASLAFTAADNGATYVNFPGEFPVISGGTTITGWSLFSGGIYRAFVGTSVDFRALFVNGVHATRARGASNPAGWSLNGTPGGATGWTAPDGTVAAYGNLTNVEIVTNANWSQARCQIASASGTNIVMQTPCWSIITQENTLLIGGKPAGYWNAVSHVENAFELMASGSWYLDRSAGYLYYWPPGGTMTGLTVVAPSVSNLVTITGASSLTLRGLTFSHANWIAANSGGLGYVGSIGGQWLNGAYTDTASIAQAASIKVTSSTNVTLDHLALTNHGTGGVDIEGGSSNVTISASLMSEIAGTPINMGYYHTCPAIQEDTVTIQNNLATGGSFGYQDAAGIYTVCVKNFTISHNEIDGGHAQVMYAGDGQDLTKKDTNGVISNNIFGGGCDLFIDCGVFYGNNDQSTTGSFADGLRFTGNYLNAPLSNGQGGCMYIDYFSQWYTMTGNVCRTPIAKPFINMPNTPVLHVIFTGNYSDSSTTANSASNTTDVTLTPNTVGSGSSSVAGALAIIAAAGVTAGVIPGPIP